MEAVLAQAGVVNVLVNVCQAGEAVSVPRV
jgi:hypothetical protein